MTIELGSVNKNIESFADNSLQEKKSQDKELVENVQTIKQKDHKNDSHLKQDDNVLKSDHIKTNASAFFAPEIRDEQGGYNNNLQVTRMLDNFLNIKKTGVEKIYLTYSANSSQANNVFKEEKKENPKFTNYRISGGGQAAVLNLVARLIKENDKYKALDEFVGIIPISTMPAGKSDENPDDETVKKCSEFALDRFKSDENIKILVWTSGKKDKFMPSIGGGVTNSRPLHSKYQAMLQIMMSTDKEILKKCHIDMVQDEDINVPIIFIEQKEIDKIDKNNLSLLENGPCKIEASLQQKKENNISSVKENYSMKVSDQNDIRDKKAIDNGIQGVQKVDYHENENQAPKIQAKKNLKKSRFGKFLGRMMFRLNFILKPIRIIFVSVMFILIKPFVFIQSLIKNKK